MQTLRGQKQTQMSYFCQPAIIDGFYHKLIIQEIFLLINININISCGCEGYFVAGFGGSVLRWISGDKICEMCMMLIYVGVGMFPIT